MNLSSQSPPPPSERFRSCSQQLPATWKKHFRRLYTVEVSFLGDRRNRKIVGVSAAMFPF